MYVEAKTEFFYSSYAIKESNQIVFEVSQGVLQHKNYSVRFFAHCNLYKQRVLYLVYNCIENSSVASTSTHHKGKNDIFVMKL